jgi:hypothetical protein
VYELDGRIPRAGRKPSIALAAPAPAAASRGRMQVRAGVGGDSFYEVTFLARAGRGSWRRIGTDDNAPYRVFHDVSRLRAGTALRYKAIVLDNRRRTRTSGTRNATVPAPAVTIEAPAPGAKVRDEVEVRAIADPERATHVVAFERSVAGGPWTPIGSDDSSPAYTVFDDISGLDLATGTEIRYRAILTEPDGTRVVSAERAVEQAPPPVTTAIVHYLRPGDDYGQWGLHLWGDAIMTPTAWISPLQRVTVDEFGARYEIALKDDTKPVNFIMHLPDRDDVPDGREPGGDRSFLPATSPEIWLVQGDPTVYTGPPG